MQAIVETLFDTVYLFSVITIGILMIRKSKGNRQFTMFGIMAVLLGSGDAFHLVPRAVALCTTGLENFTVQLGLGKWITSITMTIFYVVLYHIWRERYQIKGYKATTAVGDPKSKHSPAACFTLVDAKFRAKLSMPYALMKELSRFTAYRSPVRMYAAIFQKRTPCSRSPSGNPPHFADRRDESVIVGYCTSAEVPFGCSKGTPGGRSPLKKGVAA